MGNLFMRKLVLTTTLICATTATFAEPLNYNILNIQAEASRQVSNDEMSAVLYIEKTNKQPSELANQVSQLMNQGLALAKKYPQVQVKTGPQRTYPIYDNDSNKLKEWRARAEIQINSKDFKATSNLISELQQNFQTQNIQFSVSDEQRNKVENELLVDAARNFQQRAQTLAQAWHKTTYDVVNLNIDTNNNSAPAPMMLLMAKSRVADSAVSQDVSSGESKITVSANGTIQLK